MNVFHSYGRLPKGKWDAHPTTIWSRELWTPCPPPRHHPRHSCDGAAKRFLWIMNLFGLVPLHETKRSDRQICPRKVCWKSHDDWSICCRQICQCFRGYSLQSTAIKWWIPEAKQHLVGGWATPLKNMKVNWDDDIPNIWENKKCSKPPTRHE